MLIYNRLIDPRMATRQRKLVYWLRTLGSIFKFLFLADWGFGRR
jgi:hypothetical protein